MKILITTGIYPPKIGGPAQYAKNLKVAFEEAGHSVKVKTYGFEDYLPSGLRHLFFLIKIVPAVIWSDQVFMLDTFSVGAPTMLACWCLGRSGIIRTGGDFLWEQFVERTGRKVLLRKFYDTEKTNFSLKEKFIYLLTGWTLRHCNKVIFSTDWQRQIFLKAYGLDLGQTAIVENYYGSKTSDLEPQNQTFIASTRPLVWKNLDLLKQSFKVATRAVPTANLFLENLPYPDFLQKMSDAYAVILVSLGDISPNMILDAIQLNRPFICTREVGIYDRIKDAGLFVDPLDEEAVQAAITELLDMEGYRRAKEKVKSFNFTHSWREIAEEFLAVANLMS